MNYFEKRYNKASINQKDVKYDFWRYGNELGKKLDDAEVEYICSFINELIQKESDYKKVRLIDVGCGTGYHAINIFKKLKNDTLNDIEVLCIDTNVNYTEQFKHNIINDHDITKDDCSKFIIKNTSIENIKHFIDESVSKNDKSLINVIMMVGVVQYLTQAQIYNFLKT